MDWGEDGELDRWCAVCRYGQLGQRGAQERVLGVVVWMNMGYTFIYHRCHHPLAAATSPARRLRCRGRGRGRDRGAVVSYPYDGGPSASALEGAWVRSCAYTRTADGYHDAAEGPAVAWTGLVREGETRGAIWTIRLLRRFVCCSLSSRGEEDLVRSTNSEN